MFIVSALPHAESGRNDHREGYTAITVEINFYPGPHSYTPHYIKTIKSLVCICNDTYAFIDSGHWFFTWITFRRTFSDIMGNYTSFCYNWIISHANSYSRQQN